VHCLCVAGPSGRLARYWFATGLDVVLHVVWVVGSAPGDATTVRVVTETTSPGLGCRTRVTVFGATIVAVVVVGVTAGTLVAEVDAAVRRGAVVVVSAGMLTDVVVVAVAAEEGRVARSEWRAGTLRVPRTNDGAAASTSAVFSGSRTPVAWTPRGPAPELF
jgi:hypothetical protein